MAFAFTACKKTDGGSAPAPAACTKHTWGKWTVKTAADETTDGEEERTCTACGEEETQFGEYAAGTDGLAYELINGNAAYRVRKGTADTSGEVIIPAFYRPNANRKYLPVTEVGAADDVPNTSAFQETAITGVTFLEPSNITSIGGYAFRKCTALTSVTLPEGVERIGESAFSECAALTSVALPKGVDIGNSAFSECAKLTRVTIPDGVKNIGDHAFQNCNALVSITIPASVTNIGSAAFYITALTSVTIPDGVKTIGEGAFQNCNALVSVTIPASVTTIGRNAFLTTASLKSITVDAANPNYASFDGILYTREDQATLLKAPPAGIRGALTLRKGVRAIADQAFDYCRALRSVTLPEGLERIGAFAFWRCTALTNVTLPASLTYIDNRAFSDTALTSVTIPAGVTTIGRNVFYDTTALASFTADAANPNYASQDKILYNKTKTRLVLSPPAITSVTIPNSVTSIGESAFEFCRAFTSVTIPAGVTHIGGAAFHYCSALTSVTVRSATPPALDGSIVFDYNHATRQIFVPARSVAAYRAAAGWSEYASAIVAIP